MNRAAYGGHIPGAKSYHWRDAFTDDGNLKPRDEVRATLLSLGFRDGMSLIAYCTRGVRASFLNAVLTWAGFETATYAGVPLPPLWTLPMQTRCIGRR